MQERKLNCATIGVANSTDIRRGATAEENRFLFGFRQARPSCCQSPTGDVGRKIMQSSNLDGSRSLRGSCFAALWVMLAMGLGALAWPGEVLAWTGQPLAYVTSSNGISVIDTGDNTVVDTILGPALPSAVTPDGRHVYAFGPSTSDFVFNISVIDATNDKVVATVPLDVSLVANGVSL